MSGREWLDSYLEAVSGHEVRGAAVKPTGRKGTFTSRIVTYNGPPDFYGARWQPGVFTESLNRRLPVILYGHDMKAMPLGRATSWYDTPEGPVVTARLDVGVAPTAAQVSSQIENGTLTDVSVGFNSVRKREPTSTERAEGVREVIVKAELMELSVVPIGAVPGAQVLALRSLGVAPTRDTDTSVEPEAFRLARLLSRGEITHTQMAELLDVERCADEALALVARSHRRRVDQALNDPRISPEEKNFAARLSAMLANHERRLSR